MQFIAKFYRGFLALGALIVLADCAGPQVPLPPVNTHLLAISDIDDTIKDTHVTKSPKTHERDPLLFFDFLRCWKPVPGMSDVFAAWSRDDGVVFTYVSGGPPIYQRRLERFLRDNGFPLGAIYLNKSFPGPSFQHKVQTISRLLDASPRARVLLIGDSGEKDPAVYAEIQRRYPGRVSRVCIRAVTDDAGAIVRGISDKTDGGAKWQVFSQATELNVRRISKR